MRTRVSERPEPTSGSRRCTNASSSSERGSRAKATRHRISCSLDLFQELSTAFEELEVNIEEIYAQNEALEAAQLSMDREARRYRELFEQAPDGYLVTDDGGLILEANQAVSDLLATSPRHLYSKPVIVFVDSRDRRRVLTSLHEVLNSDASVADCQVTFAPPNAKAFPASVRIAASDARDGEPRTLRWLVRDVSLRVEAEQALSEEQARYRLVADSFSDVVLTTDEAGRITYVSPSSERTLGYRDEDLEGREITQIVHPDDWGALAALEDDADREGAPPSGLLNVFSHSHEILPMDVMVVRTTEGPGLSIGRCYTMRDVHEREESWQALSRERQAAIALRQADAAKDALLLAASHDLSSPVAAMAGLAQQLVRHPDLPEGDLRRIAQGLATAGSQLRAILANLLDAERVLGGHVHVRSQPTDLHPMVEAALHKHGLPPSCLRNDQRAVLAEIDPGLTARIVDNIVGNALRHTPAGTPVRVTLDVVGNEVILSVADHGPGIPDEAKELVFEAFHRQGGQSAGLGLGLFVVRRFAELQGGRAWVTDTAGGGATVMVAFASVGPGG